MITAINFSTDLFCEVLLTLSPTLYENVFFTDPNWILPPLEIAISPSDLSELPSVVSEPDDAIEIPLFPIMDVVAY